LRRRAEALQYKNARLPKEIGGMCGKEGGTGEEGLNFFCNIQMTLTYLLNAF
jgi:hypothetical protein